MITPLQVRNLLEADLTYASRIQVVSPPPSPQPITVSNPPFSRTGTMICYTGKAIKFIAPTIPWVKKVVDHVESQMVDTALVEENQRLRSQLWQVEQDGNAKAARLEARLEDALDNEQNLKEEVQRLTETNAGLEEEKQASKEENHELLKNLTKAEQEIAHVSAQLIDKQITYDDAMESKAQADQKVVTLTQERDDLVAQLVEERKAREAEKLGAREEIQAIKDEHRQELDEAMESKGEAEQKVVALTQERDDLGAQLGGERKAREAEQLAAKEANHELHVSLIKREQKVAHVDARLIKMQIAHKEEIQDLKDAHRQEMDGAMGLKAQAEQKVITLIQERDDLTVQLDAERKGREAEKLAAKEANQELHENLIKAEQKVAHVGAQLARMEVAHDGAVESKVEAELKVVALTQERDGLKAQLDEERKAREVGELAAKEEIQMIKDNHQEEMGVVLSQLAAAKEEIQTIQNGHHQEMDAAMESKAEAEQEVIALTQEKNGLLAQLDEEKAAREADKLSAKEEIQTTKDEHRQEMNVTLGQLHAAWDKATNLEGQLETTQGSLAASEDQNGFLISENRKLQKRAYGLQEKVDAVVEKAIVQATTGTKEAKVEKEEQIDDKVEQVILRATGEVKDEQQTEMDAMIEKTILQATTKGVKSEEQARIDAMVEKAIFQATTREVKAEKQEPMDFKAMLAKVQGNFEARDRQVKAGEVSPLTPPMTPYPQFPNQAVFPPTPQSPFVGRFCNQISQMGMEGVDWERKSRETRDFVADVPWS